MGATNKALFCSDMCNWTFVIHSSSCFTTCELQTFIILSGFKQETAVHSQYSISVHIFSHPVRTSLIFKSGHEHISLGTDANRKIIKNKFSLILEETFFFFCISVPCTVFQLQHYQLPANKPIYESPTPLSKDCSTLHQKTVSALHIRKKDFLPYTHSCMCSSTNRKFQRISLGYNISLYPSTIGKLIHELVIPKVKFTSLLSPIHMRITFLHGGL